jgi:hypothetical protein
MKKYKFLVPVAVAVASLVSAADAQAPSSQPVSETATRETGTPQAETATDRIDSFVLVRSDAGVLLAQHTSHESHSSHASHASHSSHASHASHSSHSSSVSLA